MKVDVPNVPADVIVQVLQAGYKIADRVLRPATVILAKGGTPAKTLDRGRAESAPGRSAEGAGGHSAHAHDHSLELAHEHDPDLVRDATGAPKSAQTVRKDRPAEKRASTVAQPVTDGAPTQKDDLMSSFGKRLENGN